MRDAWCDVADLLEDAGGCVSQVSLPHTALSIVCYHVIGEADVASNMARCILVTLQSCSMLLYYCRYDGIEFGYRAPGRHASVNALYAASRAVGFNEVVRRRILAGNYFTLRECVFT